MSIQNDKFVIKKPPFIEISILDTLTLNKAFAPSTTINQKLGVYKSNFCFDKEHHTVWYLLETKNCGTLSFTLSPKNSDDDYDFMIFKADSGDIMKMLDNGQLELIRSNISRVDKSIDGKTGLNMNSSVSFTQKGINPSFSKALNVKNGNKFLIIFDNVYDNGKGFSCYFNLIAPGQFKAKTIDALSKKAIKCDNQFCNAKGKILRAEFALSSEIVYKFKAENFTENISYDLNKEFKFIRIEKKGYFPDFILKSFMSCENDNQVVEMKPIIKNDYYLLKEIYFNEDLTLNIEKAQFAINTYKEFLRKNTAYKFQLISYDQFDNIDSKNYLINFLKEFKGFENRVVISNDSNNMLPKRSNCLVIKLIKI